MSEVGQDAPWTVTRLLSWTQDYFPRSRIEAPRLCAEILLAHAMNCQRIGLYTAFDQIPADSVRTRFRELVKEAATGRPIAYLVGRKEFFSLPFEVTPDVLIPRPETAILVERTIALARKEPEALTRLLDLGTGSGCIAISLAKHLPAAHIAAGDISEAALAVAQRNAERHDVTARVDFRAGDLFAPWSDGEAEPVPFDAIISNPPYVAAQGAPLDENVRRFAPATALFAGPDGLDVIQRILATAPAHLRPGGHLLLELAYDQAPRVRASLDPAVWTNVTTYRDHAGHERVLHVCRAAAGGAGSA